MSGPVSRWSYRVRRSWLPGRPAGWYDERQAYRLGRDLCLAGVNEWADAAGPLARAARTLGGWTVAGLKRLAGAVREVAMNSFPGPDALDDAMRDADRDANKFEHLVSNPRHARILALVWHLCRKFPGEWRPLGSARVARWLGVHRNTADKDVRDLETGGLIAVRRDPAGKTVYSYKGGDAREVAYTGPVVADDHDEPVSVPPVAAVPVIEVRRPVVALPSRAAVSTRYVPGEDDPLSYFPDVGDVPF